MKHITVQIEQEKKYLAYVISVSKNDNLLSRLAIKNIIAANIFDSKKEAERIADYWNDQFKSNNKYLYN